MLRFHNKDNVLVSIEYYALNVDNNSSNEDENLIVKWLPGVIIKTYSNVHERIKYDVKMDQQFLQLIGLNSSDFSIIQIETDNANL